MLIHTTEKVLHHGNPQLLVQDNQILHQIKEQEPVHTLKAKNPTP